MSEPARQMEIECAFRLIDDDHQIAPQPRCDRGGRNERSNPDPCAPDDRSRKHGEETEHDRADCDHAHAGRPQQRTDGDWQMTPCSREACWPGQELARRRWRTARYRREQERAEPGDVILGPAIDHNQREHERGEKAEVNGQETKKGEKLTTPGRKRDGELRARALQQPSFVPRQHSHWR